MAIVVSNRMLVPQSGPEDFMPLSVRLTVARELNAAWREFVTDMHDGPTTGPVTAEKFLKYLKAR